MADGGPLGLDPLGISSPRGESREWLCCPFFDFTLQVERDGGPVRLGLAGGPGVKEYLEDTLIPRLEKA